MTIDDAMKAIYIVRTNAQKWYIDPRKIESLGFSADGGIAIGATVRDITSSDFIATAYGPALTKVEILKNMQPLFMAVASSHPNVSVDCVALYNEWKKAGNSVELHLYEKGNKPFGMGNDGLPSDEWKDQFYEWLTAEGF